MTPSSPIEAIEPDVRREGVVRIVVGGRAAFIVPAEAARQEGLAVGAAISPDQAYRLATAGDKEAAYRTVIRLLERRSFARRDLERRMALKGHPPDMVQLALDRAAAAGYLDDREFATFYVRSRSARGRGPARLRRELLQMGVAQELIEGALEGCSTPAVVQEAIEGLIAKRAGQLKGLPPAAVRRRLLAYLARRGYTGSEVLRLVRAVA